MLPRMLRAIRLITLHLLVWETAVPIVAKLDIVETTALFLLHRAHNSVQVLRLFVAWKGAAGNMLRQSK
jgi:hypothetical protein